MQSQLGSVHPRKARPWFDRVWRRVVGSLSWYPFVLVNLIVFLLFTVIPCLWMIRYGVMDWDLFNPPKFIGLGNYTQFFTDSRLHIAIKNTVVYMLMSVPAGAFVSLLMALFVQREVPATKVFRAVYFLPQVTSITVLALVYWRLFAPRPDGPINAVLGLVGIPPQTWLLSTKLALPTIVGLSVWQGFGYTLLIWLAGMKGIPKELYDAANVDGASGWRLYLYVTLPLLRPTAAFILMISTIGALQVFSSIYLLTGGGPVFSTTTVVYYIYQRSFIFNEFGYGSAMSMAMLFFILALTLIEGKYLRYGEGFY